jgi:hypothetical protein
VIVRSIFRTHELLIGGKSDAVMPSLGLVDQAKAWGWAVLGEYPGREIVFGAVTQPWIANPTFRGLPAHEFVAFDEPGYVKIAWTLAADPMGANICGAHRNPRHDHRPNRAVEIPEILGVFVSRHYFNPASRARTCQSGSRTPGPMTWASGREFTTSQG